MGKKGQELYCNIFTIKAIELSRPYMEMKRTFAFSNWDRGKKALMHNTKSTYTNTPHQGSPAYPVGNNFVFYIKFSNWNQYIYPNFTKELCA